MTESAIIPGEACYWGVLETPVQTSAAVTFAFEALLPFAVDSLHCAFTRLPDGRILIAGVPHEFMRQRLDAPDGPSLWSIRPGQPPRFVVADASLAALHERIEFLTGAYEPAGRRRRRHAATAIWLSCCCLPAAALLAGSIHRQNAVRRAEMSLSAQEHAAIEAVVPATASTRALPPHARLLQAHRIHAGRHPGERQHDVLLVLDRIWSAIPADPGLTALEARADQRRVVLRASVKDPMHIERMTNAASVITTVDGIWRLEPPDLALGREAATNLVFTWTLQPQPQGRGQ